MGSREERPPIKDVELESDWLGLKQGLGSPARTLLAPPRIPQCLAPLGWSMNRVNRSEKLRCLVRPGNDSREGGGRRRRAGVVSAPAGGCRPYRAPTPPGQARTHFAESVLMEPVTSMSPARNSWYLVQAMAADAGSAILEGLKLYVGGVEKNDSRQFFLPCVKTSSLIFAQSFAVCS